MGRRPRIRRRSLTNSVGCTVRSVRWPRCAIAITGEGQHVDVALLDTLTNNASLTLAAMGVTAQRNGNEFGFAVPANVFACADGSVYIAVLLDAHWKVLARTVGHPELADDPGFVTIAGRSENRDVCNAIVAAWTAEHRGAEVVEILN